MIKYFKQLFCLHKYQADTQITVIRCKLCKKEHFYEHSINLYP